MHRLIKILTSRVILFVILILLQIALFFAVLFRAGLYYYISTAMSIIGVILVIYVVNKQEDPSYKISWSILILVLPVLGGFLYMLCAGRKMPKKLFKGTTRANQRMANLLSQDIQIMDELKEKDHRIQRIFSHAWQMSDFPVYQNTNLTYFRSGEEAWPVLLERLREAKHFIFLEYYIIDEGEMWDSILEILKEKVKNGVKVVLIYDDFGCASTLPYRYDKKLQEFGIETYRFNRLRPAIIIQMNNRDHRKLCIIDNQYGFTGGINLADEYVNRIKRFGYWRDSCVMLEGEAVWSMTDMFLGMYSYLSGRDNLEYEQYRIPHKAPTDGYVQPFSDTPTDQAELGLAMHLNLINQAKDYIYIDTPYLVINNDVITALCLAAQKGVDVRILVPHIPDKQYVFTITKSNYEPLIQAGVKIYEFTPGFNHAKNIVSDDCIGLIGSVNTDYRSYYLHFEDGVLFYQSHIIQEMKQHFLDSLAESEQVTLESCRKVRLAWRIVRSILKLFSPLF
ncbi:MAG: cardiolipin synthase [Solobacterium sp.]|nr:cardiolipin synthase [Solobacterium sp.]